MNSFFSELKRRNVYKVAVAYAVVGWLLVQIATQVFPFFEIPNWAVRLVVLAIVIGFPIALVVAWAFEATPAGIKRTETADAGREHSRGRTWIYVVVIGVAFSLCLFFLGRFTASRVQTSGSPDIASKSIAVLPFENLSDDKANAFFASGIQDEILTALAKISGLKVISRTSTAHYQSSPQNLPEIAKQLGVAHILEGSVQKVADKVHINLQLIRAETDAHVWAQSYDRSLADIFSVEAEVARSVADELRATLSPEEKARVEAKPTENSDAYILYLRANEYANRPSDLFEDEQKAVDLYTQAVALDPGFALAHARLAVVLAHLYLDFQPTEEMAKRARSEAEESLRLQPNLGEGHHARAMCLYWTQKNYEAALRELEIAGRLLPNNSDVESVVAYIRRRQGRWTDARAGMEHALQRDPRNAVIAHEYYRTLCYLRDWPGAKLAAARSVAVAPGSPTIRIDAAYVDVLAKGDVGPLRTAVAATPRNFDPDGQITLARYDAAMLMRDFETATAESATEMTPLVNGGIRVPKNYLLGCIALARGENEKAKGLLESCRESLKSQTAAAPTDPGRHAQLGVFYAYLGRKDDAIRAVQRAIELQPESSDALDGPSQQAALALVYARCGEPDRALPIIERLLTVAGPGGPRGEWSITISDLRLRWQWDPLRNNPRFQKILSSPEPVTIYK